ncbi:MAG: efflux RND transporter permease subunit [Spirochaetaceae bacterium]|jgi:multidrug efflux pump subunit AcrB|nr:efflux RND transporter permease subunit [Spirochaetaceae bacterium]
MADLTRPKKALCIILGLLAAAFFIIRGWGKTGPGLQGSADESFTVTQRFYGVDAAEMERIAAIPLEDAMTGITGLKRIVSSCENGRARVSCYFEGKMKGRYEMVRDAAQRVYESLPAAAQRPEFSFSGDSRVPVWTAAVTAPDHCSLGTILEKTLKPALEGLPGAGEVEISGTGLTEIVITLREQEAAARNIGVAHLAALLGSSDLLLSGGTLRERRGSGESPAFREIPVLVDGRYGTVENLRHALIPLRDDGGNRTFALLGDIAVLEERERTNENRSRLNGKEAALIAVMGNDGADLGKLSLFIGRELAKYPDLDFTVLSDRGEAERDARNSALGAAMEGSCAVALLAALICFRKRRGSLALICALTVPVVSFFSAALLILLGFSLDKLVLAGLASGSGAAVDAAILGAEYFHSCETLEEGKKALEGLAFPLVSGSLTTIIALLPLMARDRSGINTVAWAVASVNGMAMILSLTLLPPLFLWDVSRKKSAASGQGSGSVFVRKSALTPRRSSGVRPASGRLIRGEAAGRHRRRRRLVRAAARRLAALVRGVLRRPLAVGGCWLGLSVLGIAALCAAGADAEQESPENSIYAQIEFDGGLHVDKTDAALALYGEALKKHPGIRTVQTVARTGTGSVLVSFDPRRLDPPKVRELLRTIPVPGGFVYILESAGNDRSWRIIISGSEGRRCRELAVEAARICSVLPELLETALNFKDGGPRLILEPDRERLAQGGFSFGALGQTTRRGVHGPVAYKRMERDGERDVRIRGGAAAGDAGDLGDLFLMGKDGPVFLSSLVRMEKSREESSIQREDRRRSASISIRTGVVDPRRIRDRVMGALKVLELPPGYTIEFDPPAIKAAEEVNSRAYLFVLVLLFCYMVIAGFKESLSFPLAVLAVVPPSLSLPILYLFCRSYPLNMAAVSSFVVVSGIAVNAAVLMADALQYEKPEAFSVYRVLRRRLPVLAATTGTTVAGSIPFLFVGNGAALVVKVLSLVNALGVAASALCAITLIPALIKLFPRILHSPGGLHIR